VELKTAGLALERPLYTLKLRGRHLSRSALAFLEDFDEGPDAVDRHLMKGRPKERKFEPTFRNP